MFIYVFLTDKNMHFFFSTVDISFCNSLYQINSSNFINAIFYFITTYITSVYNKYIFSASSYKNFSVNNFSTVPCFEPTVTRKAYNPSGAPYAGAFYMGR